MKVFKIILSIYQSIIVIASILFIVTSIPWLSNAESVNFGNLFVAGLIVIPTMIFCLCNVAKTVFVRFGFLSKWTALMQLSLVLSILWTALFMYLFIFETTSTKKNSASTKDTKLIGNLSPDFEHNTLDGKKFCLSDQRGKVVLIDFWGTWCGACVSKLPHTQDIYDNYQQEGLIVIGIHSEFNTGKVEKFLSDHNYTFPTIIDPGNIAKDYGITGWPTYYLIDRDGYIVWGPEHSIPSRNILKKTLKN